MRTLIAFAFLILCSAPGWCNPLVEMETSRGTIRLELYEDKAPETVRNFLSYVDEGHYDGTIFHRVIKEFMIQGGGYTANLEEKPTRTPIRNEADNALKNERGTIAMARTPAVDSATAQFFINLKDNPFLNHGGKNPRSFGYAVFGKVVSGLDVVESIGKMKTGGKGPLFQNLPEETVVLKKVRRIDRKGE